MRAFTPRGAFREFDRSVVTEMPTESHQAGGRWGSRVRDASVGCLFAGTALGAQVKSPVGGRQHTHALTALRDMAEQASSRRPLRGVS
jgi:hypothetical protein